VRRGKTVDATGVAPRMTVQEWRRSREKAKMKTIDYVVIDGNRYPGSRIYNIANKNTVATFNARKPCQATGRVWTA
jgi:hypothetical protein